MANCGGFPMKVGAEFVVAALEGTLLKDSDPFPYFMLVAFEGSGLIRFVFLLLLWPLIVLLRAAGHGELALRVMVFAAAAGVRESEIAAVARTVLPKFYAEDVDLAAWRLFSSRRRRAVVTAMPRIMVAWFAREHLGADEVAGPELAVNRFGIATGFLDSPPRSSGAATLDLGRTTAFTLSGDQLHPLSAAVLEEEKVARPKPVVFHDGRMVRRPTPTMALLVVLWVLLGIILALVRLVAALLCPFHLIRPMARFFGWELIVHGRPPATSSTRLLVCNHRTVMDGITISICLGRKIPSVTYSLSRITESLSLVKLVTLSRQREADAKRIKAALAKSDLVICPEGTTCREPFLLRFSMLFAELTDEIVPVAVDCRTGMFHATTARGWKAMDLIFFLMNPKPTYEITFLDQLPPEETCAGGKRPQEVASYVQRVLADTLGFECTEYTRKDKYMLLAGHEGLVSPPAGKPTAGCSRQ